MSPKTTPNAGRPSVDRLAAFAGGATVSPARSGKGITPVVVEVFVADPANQPSARASREGIPSSVTDWFCFLGRLMGAPLSRTIPSSTSDTSPNRC